MKTPKSVESHEPAPSNKKIVKKLTLDRETVRSMTVKTGVQTGTGITLTGLPCQQSRARSHFMM